MSRRLTGLLLVVALHVAVVYALFTGLASRVIDVVRSPVEARVIEAPERPAQSQALAAPPPPQFEAMLPAVLEPPKIRIAPPVAPPKAPPPSPAAKPAPTPPAPAVVESPPLPAPTEASPPPLSPNPPAATPVAAPAPVAPSPVAAAPPAVAALPRAPPSVPILAGVACANYRAVMGDVAYPREAIRQGIEEGEALIQFTLTASGEVKDVKALQASNPIFARTSMRLVAQLKCQGRGHAEPVTVPFSYKLQ